MSKDATVYLLDVSRHMYAHPRAPGETSHLEKALFCIREQVQAKLIQGRKTDVICVILMGTQETHNYLALGDSEQYQHVSILFPDQFNLLAVPSLSLLEAIQKPESLEGQDECDVVDGLIIGLMTIDMFCRNLKYTKQIFLYTCAESAFVVDGSDEVIDRAKEMNVAVNVIGFNFGKPESSEIKRSTEQYLGQCMETTDGELWDGDEALALLQSLHTKNVRPATLFRGPLVLGDPQRYPTETLAIPIFMYNRTVEAKLPTAKKWSKVAPNQETVCMVRASQAYYSVHSDGLDGNLQPGDDRLERHEVIKGYKYGKTIVPFNTVDEEAFKLKTEKSFNIIGFISLDKVHRWMFMGSVASVMAEPGNLSASRSFYAFCRSLYQTQACALVRYVSRDSLAPKIGALIPRIDTGETYCLFVQLPFAEDCRDYSFISLRPLTEPTLGLPESNRVASVLNSSTSFDAHSVGSGVSKGTSVAGPPAKRMKFDARRCSDEEVRHRMDDFVDSMDLMNPPPSGSDGEAFKSQDVFNPVYQRLWQCIIARALNGPASEIPPVDARFMAGIKPLPELEERAKDASLKLSEAFNVKKVESKKSNTTKDVWMARARNANLPLLDGREGSVAPSESSVSSEKRRLAELTVAKVEKIGSITPAADFRAMCARRDKDCIPAAMEQMPQVILQLITNSADGEYYDKALEAIHEFRRGCIIESESDCFNAFLERLQTETLVKTRLHHRFWSGHVVPGGIGAITSDECPDCGAH
ncbi:SPOC like C-terminal domain-containing protein [Polychytrium aggregatum]|uniref:SPOC like C-terminal domain-containing protein n=1 Tax=Polychytrium aggregatum TaxID=110093 RepID=UPI0022FE5A80|nr:SPOC like C-terminal domain-containing protein [Polychytrium aggregatum]KAI9205546.1 SPOC like C-terminal domain-containing protein [Polychytrium aggregatum]